MDQFDNIPPIAPAHLEYRAPEARRTRPLFGVFVGLIGITIGLIGVLFVFVGIALLFQTLFMGDFYFKGAIVIVGLFFMFESYRLCRASLRLIAYGQSTAPIPTRSP
jgi:hypothetical protein